MPVRLGPVTLLLWRQLYKELPKDPWQTDYIYRNPGLKSLSAYDLFSAGPDRKPDIEDDD